MNRPTEDTPTPQGDLDNHSLHSQSEGFKSLTAVSSKHSSSYKADMLSLSVAPVLMITALLGFGLTNYRNIFVKLLGTLVILICLGLGVLWMFVLGKSLLDDTKKGNDLITEGLSQGEDTPSRPGEHKKQELEGLQ